LWILKKDSKNDFLARILFKFVKNISMKKLLLFTFIIISTFTQAQHFKIENKEIFWEATFKTTDTDVLSQIDKTDTRVETNKIDNTGKGVRLFSVCKLRKYSDDDISQYSLSFDFKVTFTETTYTVRVYNLNYVLDSEFRVDKRKFDFTRKFSQNSETEISTGSNHMRLFDCFEENLMKTFKTKNSQIALEKI
jgi:hypothetical protein